MDAKKRLYFMLLLTIYLLVGIEMFALLYVCESMPGVISICFVIELIMKCAHSCPHEDKVLSVQFRYPGGSSKK